MDSNEQSQKPPVEDKHEAKAVLVDTPERFTPDTYPAPRKPVCRDWEICNRLQIRAHRYRPGWITSMMGGAVSLAVASDINIDKVFAKDKTEIVKVIIAVATAVWGIFTNKKKKAA